MVDRKAPKPQASATKLCYAFEVAGRISGANFDMVRAGAAAVEFGWRHHQDRVTARRGRISARDEVTWRTSSANDDGRFPNLLTPNEKRRGLQRAIH
jgi:hypothetical protein